MASASSRISLATPAPTVPNPTTPTRTRFSSTVLTCRLRRVHRNPGCSQQDPRSGQFQGTKARRHPGVASRPGNAANSPLLEAIFADRVKEKPGITGYRKGRNSAAATRGSDVCRTLWTPAGKEIGDCPGGTCQPTGDGLSSGRACRDVVTSAGIGEIRGQGERETEHEPENCCRCCGFRWWSPVVQRTARRTASTGRQEGPACKAAAGGGLPR